MYSEFVSGFDGFMCPKEGQPIYGPNAVRIKSANFVPDSCRVSSRLKTTAPSLPSITWIIHIDSPIIIEQAPKRKRDWFE